MVLSQNARYRAAIFLGHQLGSAQHLTKHLRRKLGKKMWQFFPYDAQNRLRETQKNAYRHHVQTIDKEVAIAPMFAHLQTSSRELLRIPPQLQQPCLALHPFPEPAVVRQGPAVSEPISRQF
jgi:hypothetical protein